MHKEFVHRTLGVHFYVEESRVDEYKAAGHKLVKEQKAPEPEQPSGETEQPSEKTAVKKAATKKTAKKR